MEKYSMPDKRGHFGNYGGRFIAETLMEAVKELEAMYIKLKDDKKFKDEFN